MKSVKIRIVQKKALNEELILQMYDLYFKYYEKTTFEIFKNDLNEKTHIILLFNKKDSSLIGFSTLKRVRIKKPVNCTYIFSGDTVIDKEFWGTRYLQVAFFNYIFKTKLQNLFRPVLWFLISKGHKTYLMMRKNFHSSFPNYLSKTPELYQSVMKLFYSDKFGKAYHDDTGLITFEKSMGNTRECFHDITDEIRNDPDGAFFLKTNPDFHKGVELACVAEIRFSDLCYHINKYILKRKRRK